MRAIPTYVGQTLRHRGHTPNPRSYPHTRGANLPLVDPHEVAGELSPRVWGKRYGSVLWRCRVGAIPTCVGQTTKNAQVSIGHSELSPRVWGKLHEIGGAVTVCGAIPTCVGQTLLDLQE